MKRSLKVISIIIVSIILLIVGYLYISPDKNINGLYLIPNDAMYILDSDDPIENWRELSQNNMWQFLKEHESLSDIADDANYLDTLISDNSFLFKLFGSRKFIMSAHKTRPGDYDFIFAIDLKKTAKTGVLYTALEKVLKASGFKVTTRMYKDYEFLESMDDVKDVLTMCKVENFLVCSYSASLVEKSVDAFQNPQIARDIYFQDVYKRVATKGLSRLYIPYAQIDEYVSCYMAQPDELITDLSHTLRYSALDFIIDDNEWKIKGVTNIDETVDSYLLALMRSGQSKNRVHEILSNRTAWHLSFNFSSIEKFYEELTAVLKLDQTAYDEFTKSQKKIENLLGISVKKHLLDWISDEVSVAQLRSNAYASREDNLVVCLRTNDMTLAKKSLQKVADQVKKKTPGKFKKILYRNYEIQFLDIKGFFKTFFGKAFQKLEKPYYTTIGDYVVFSNNPRTIIGLIEDYENERTLGTNKAHTNFREQASDKSSLRIYISPENTYPLLGKFAKSQTSSTLKRNEKYFTGLESFGFQFNAEGAMLETFAYLKMKAVLSEDDSQIPEQELAVKYDLYAVTTAAVDSIFVLQMIEDDIYKKYYPNGKDIEIRAETKDEIMHGKYEEFYPDGTIRARGKYRNGKKSGSWKYYDENGDLEDKHRF